jgi:uncharacterized protein (DUF427 family)
MSQPPPEAIAARSRWRWTGRERPPWAHDPGPGQESVWDYPRPPIVVRDHRRVEVHAPSGVLADSVAAVRLLETASAPAVYVPPADVDTGRLVAAAGSSVCEWKGVARYWALAEQPGEAVAWDYPEPWAPFEALAGWFSFYPGRVRCLLDGEVVRPQPGGFYGGWVTDAITGPIKGEPGTSGW